jgi:hypothetical protein
MTGICPSCGGPLAELGDRCRHCGQGTTRRYFTGTGEAGKPAAPPDITLPCPIPDARFTVDSTWIQGELLLTDLGVYFLAASDGPWTPDRLLMIVPPDPSKPRQFAPGSMFIPLNHIERFQHARLTSFAMITTGGKKPLRLGGEGWKVIDSYAAKMGIPSA